MAIQARTILTVDTVTATEMVGTFGLDHTAKVVATTTSPARLRCPILPVRTIPSLRMMPHRIVLPTHKMPTRNSNPCICHRRLLSNRSRYPPIFLGVVSTTMEINRISITTLLGTTLTANSLSVSTAALLVFPNDLPRIMNPVVTSSPPTCTCHPHFPELWNNNPKRPRNKIDSLLE